MKKRLILVAEEVDGHAAAWSAITTTQKDYEKVLKEILYYENELMYTFINEFKESDNVITRHYVGSGGEITITTINFNAYKEIQNEIYYGRTG